MLTVRPSRERGHFDHGWLDTFHTFSFGDYHDPRHMGFRSLRVINEDFVAPGGGFGMHGHRDMEIVTFIVSGALEHRDSLGSGAIIRPGEIQRMTAGTGVEHSEFNPSETEPVHLLQIWLRPRQRGLLPSYEQKAIPSAHGVLTLLASPDGRDCSVTIQQDAAIHLVRLPAHGAAQIEIPSARHGWLQVVSGNVSVLGATSGVDVRLAAGDGLAVSEESLVRLHVDQEATALWFDLS